MKNVRKYSFQPLEGSTTIPIRWLEGRWSRVQQKSLFVSWKLGGLVGWLVVRFKGSEKLLSASKMFRTIPTRSLKFNFSPSAFSPAHSIEKIPFSPRNVLKHCFQRLKGFKTNPIRWLEARCASWSFKGSKQLFTACKMFKIIPSKPLMVQKNSLQRFKKIPSKGSIKFPSKVQKNSL